MRRKEFIRTATGLAAPIAEGCLAFKSFPLNQPVKVAFELPVREMTLHFRKGKIRARLKGDQVIAMENFGADWTYFPPL
jgi:hypothetical protein